MTVPVKIPTVTPPGFEFHHKADAEEAGLADYLSSAPDMDGLDADAVEHFDGWDFRGFVIMNTGFTTVNGRRRFRRRLAVYEVGNWGRDDAPYRQYLVRITFADYDRVKRAANAYEKAHHWRPWLPAR